MVTYVLGGGVSGLNTAREIAKRGKKVVLIEAEEKVGGLAGYVSAFGRNLDLGPHIFHTPDKEVQDYLLHEFPGCFYERTHWAANFKNGKFYDYPISREFIDSLPAETRNKIHKELNEENEKQGKNAVTYSEYIEAIAGPTLKELFFTKYPEKLWGRPTTELDANWAPKRVQIRDERSPFFGNQWSAVGRDGTATIINELERQCNEFGVEIYTSAKIVSLTVNKFKRVTEIVTEETKFEIQGSDVIVNTLPLDVVSALLGEGSSVEYRGVMLAYIHTNNVAPFPAGIDFIYVDDLKIIFNRVSDQNTFVAEPNTTSTVLCCEVTYSQNDHHDRIEETEILEKVQHGLIELEILSPSEIIAAKLIKLPRVYPMFELGYREKMNAALARVGQINNIQTLGSLAEFAYADLQILFAKSADLAKRLCDKTPVINKIGHHKPTLSFNSKFKLLEKEIGGDSPCFNIAEIGLNHNGSEEMAKELIDVAHRSGFDAVKFQSFKSENRSARYGKTSKYVEKVTGIEETDFEMFSKCELSFEQHQELFKYCRDRGISVFSAPFDEESVDMLEALEVDAYKVASMELSNERLIRYVAKTGKPIILSTGMATLAEVEDALAIVSDVGNENIALLHCTSIYPAPADTINLRAMQTMREAFKIPVGFSDHFSDDTMSIAAIALGAQIIEKHVTLDRRLEGPDHALSLAPHEQHSFIRAIRNVEVGLGNGVKRPHRDEARSEVRFRKSMHFARKLKRGHKIVENDITFKAPCFGILPKFEDIVLGMSLKRDVDKDEAITWDILQ